MSAKKKGLRLPRRVVRPGDAPVASPGVSLVFTSDDHRDEFEASLISYGRNNALMTVAQTVRTKTMADWQKLLDRVTGEADANNEALLVWLAQQATPESAIVTPPATSMSPGGIIVP